MLYTLMFPLILGVKGVRDVSYGNIVGSSDIKLTMITRRIIRKYILTILTSTRNFMKSIFVIQSVSCHLCRAFLYAYFLGFENNNVLQ